MRPRIYSCTAALTVLLPGSRQRHDVMSLPLSLLTSGVVKYTYAQWFQPYSAHRRYCQLPVSGRNMRRFLQFRLGCHKLPIATGRRVGVVRASRHCTFCSAGTLGDEQHLVFECASLAALRLSILICLLSLPLPCVSFSHRVIT